MMKIKEWLRRAEVYNNEMKKEEQIID